MIQQKSSQILLAVFCFAFFLLQSCKTEPNSNSETLTSSKPFTVVAHLNAEPDMIHPILSTSGYSRSVSNQIYSNLVHYDTRTLGLSPMLAKAVPDSKTVTEGEHAGKISRTYEIHETATWGDGKPVTGYDVDFTLKAVMNPKVPAAQYRSFSNEFKALEIDESNPKKFTIYSTEYFLGDYIFCDIPIFPAHIFDPSGVMKEFTVKQLSNTEEAQKLADSNPRLQDFADQYTSEKFSRDKNFVIGSGPYVLDEWLTGQRIVLKKKKDWWGDKLVKDYPLLQAKPTTIIYRPISDPTTATTELKSGGIDVMNMIRPEPYGNLKESAQGQKVLNFFEQDVLQIYYIGLNNNRPKLSDKRVRRALAHLVNKDDVINTIMNGYGKKIVSPIHPSKPHYNKDLPNIDLDIEKAIALLKEAGWEDTNNNGIVDKMIDGEREELVLEYLASANGVGERIGKLIVNNAKRAGIDIKITSKESTTVRKMMAARDYDMATGAWGQDPSLDDPYQNWHTDNDVPSGGNRFGFGNEVSDNIIEKIRSRISSEERTKLYKELQQIIFDEQPCIFLLAPKGRMAINKKFNYEPSTRKPNIFENEFVMK